MARVRYTSSLHENILASATATRIAEFGMASSSGWK